MSRTTRVVPVLIIGLAVWSADFAKVGCFRVRVEPSSGKAPPERLYLGRGNGYLVSLKASGAQLQLHLQGKSAQLSSRLVGAKHGSRMEALDPLPGRSSYFRGQDRAKWLTGIPNFARVRSAGVYPGIDLIYYGNQSRLEYDFVVAPSADPNVIRMRFDGARSMRTDTDGNLVLSTSAGDIIQQKPVIYQTINGKRQAIAGSILVQDSRTVAFKLASYD